MRLLERIAYFFCPFYYVEMAHGDGESAHPVDYGIAGFRDEFVFFEQVGVLFYFDKVEERIRSILKIIPLKVHRRFDLIIHAIFKAFSGK